MFGHRNCRKVETEKRVRLGGREDVDGRCVDPGRGDRDAALHADRSGAIHWLLGHRQYASAHRKATAETLIEPKGAMPCLTQA
jgi:hypothetical protein